MDFYFNIRYEFDRKQVHHLIDERIMSGNAGYICVVDGVALTTANRTPEYLDALNQSMFSICDSSYVPLYLKWVYGIGRQQYCGSQIFMDIIGMRKYRMLFLGGHTKILEGLRANLSGIDERIRDMIFCELPFCDVDKFDYPAIARTINESGVDIIWVSLGAPKQEMFMRNLHPYLKRGVMIAVGAVFKFYSGRDVRRAPEWMIKWRLEFVYRIFTEPKKQLKRCAQILYRLPGLLLKEYRKARVSG
jgi:N-acetylglucosaminyldiphosphoundecaprenol N-acetyl-beta-D-mannosaminyltransferase